MDIYARVSKDYDGTLRSVNSQEEDGRDRVAEQADEDWVVGEVHKDHALSAWNPKVVRPSWERLMTRLESGQAHGVVVYDLSRFTRKPIEGERLISLAERGVLVASIENHYNLMDADGRKHFRDAMNAAAFESDKISQRVRRGKAKKARRGQSNSSSRGFGIPGRPPRPDGWQKGDPEPDPVPDTQVAAERDVLREVARRVLAGEPLERLADELNERGIRTVKGGPWATNNLRNTVCRPALAGLVSHNGEIVGELRGVGEPVLDRETWEAVNAVFAARRRGRPASYLLSSLVFCGRCGHGLTGQPRAGYYPDGEQHRSYFCQSCKGVAIDMRFADATVEAAVKERLGDPRHAERLARQASAARDERERIRADIARAEQTRTQLADRLGRGEITDDMFDTANTALRARLARLHEQLAEVEAPAPMPPAAAADIEREWDEGGLHERRALLRRAFPTLTILPAIGRGRAAINPDRFAWDGLAPARED